MIVFPAKEKLVKNRHFPQTILSSLDAFYTLAAAAQWQTPLSIKQTFPTADVLKNGRVIFDIDEQYHLVVKIHFSLQAIWVEFFEPYGKLPELLPARAQLRPVQ